MTEQKLRKMTSSSNLRDGSVWIDKLFEMINHEFKAQGTNIKCCRILGSVAGSKGDSKLRVFAHACAISALSLRMGELGGLTSQLSSSSFRRDVKLVSHAWMRHAQWALAFSGKKS